MRVGELVVRNLRGIAEATVPLADQLTVLIGPNNCGKSTVLDALVAVLGYRRAGSLFVEADLRLEREGQDLRATQPIQVEVRVDPTKGSRFEPGELGDMLPDLDATGAEFVRFRLSVAYDPDPAVRGLRSELQRINAAAQVVADDLAGFPFPLVLPVRRFGPEREFERGIVGRGSDWSRLLADIDADASVVEEAIKQMRSGSRHFIENTKPIVDLGSGLQPAAERVGLPPGSILRFSAAPVDPSDLMSGITLELRLAGGGRAFLPPRHGLGTQGTLLFALYDLYVRRVLRADEGGVSPVLAVEELEAHQHPTAQRAMARSLRKLPGQVVASTHSPEVVRTLSSANVVVLRVDGPGGRCFVSQAPARPLHEHALGLFAKCIVLVEGHGEAATLAIFARALGHDLNVLGIELLNAGGQESIPGLWECFGPPGYRFPTICVGDADQVKPLRSFLTTAVKHGRVAAVPLPTDQAGLEAGLAACSYFHPPWNKAMEHVLVDADAALVDQAFVNAGEDPFPQWRASRATSQVSAGVQLQTLSDYDARVYRLSKRKADLPVAIAELLVAGPTGGTRVPQCYRRALDEAVRLAKG